MSLRFLSFQCCSIFKVLHVRFRRTFASLLRKLVAFLDWLFVFAVKRLCYYITLSFVCQHLFETFFQGQRRILFAWLPLLFVPFQVYLEICCKQQISEDWRRFSGGCLCDSLYIISCLSPFVNTFFYLFYLFFCLFSLPSLFFPLLRLFYGKLAAYNHCCPVVITWNCPCVPLFSLHCICTNQQHIK